MRRIFRHFFVGRIGLLLAFAVLLAISPVGGVVAASLITGLDIVDGSIKPVDLGKGSVTRIKLATNAVNGYKVVDGSIDTADIADGAITGAKIAPGLNADSVDGKHAGDFAPANHNHDNRYYTKTESDANYASNNHSHDTTTTATLAIPASALAKRGSYDFYLNDGWAYGIGESPTYADAPVVLPDHAAITRLAYDSWDDSGVFDSRAMLYRWSPAGLEIMSTVYSSGAAPAWQTVDTTSIDSPIIDNSQYGYFVQMRMYGTVTSSIRIGTIRLTYDYQP